VEASPFGEASGLSGVLFDPEVRASDVLQVTDRKLCLDPASGVENLDPSALFNHLVAVAVLVQDLDLLSLHRCFCGIHGFLFSLVSVLLLLSYPKQRTCQTQKRKKFLGFSSLEVWYAVLRNTDGRKNSEPERDLR